MTYSNAWSANIINNTTDLDLVDDFINRVLVDVQERMNTIIGNSNWSAGADPVIDNSTIKNLVTICADILLKPSINATDGQVPYRSAAGILSDSGLAYGASEFTTAKDLRLTGTNLIRQNAKHYGAITNFSGLQSIGTSATLMGFATPDVSDGVTWDTVTDAWILGATGMYMVSSWISGNSSGSILTLTKRVQVAGVDIPGTACSVALPTAAESFLLSSVDFFVCTAADATQSLKLRMQSTVGSAAVATAGGFSVCRLY